MNVGSDLDLVPPLPAGDWVDYRLLLLTTKFLPARVGYGLVFGLILLLSHFQHIVGHILDGRLVGHPMSASLIIGYQFALGLI